MVELVTSNISPMREAQPIIAFRRQTSDVRYQPMVGLVESWGVWEQPLARLILVVLAREAV